MSKPEELLMQEVFASAKAAVERHGAETFTRADVEHMLRECAVAWYARGSRDVQLAVRMSLEARDAGSLQ